MTSCSSSCAAAAAGCPVRSPSPARRRRRPRRWRERSGRDGDVLAGDTDVAAPHAPVTDQARRDETSGVAGDGEAAALRRQDDRGVDADHLAARVTSGPPELPGLSAASVWMMSSISRPERARSERPSALTTPAVTVAGSRSGLPIAMAIWPTRMARESPSLACRRPRSASMRITARSVSGSSPTSRRAWTGRRAACRDEAGAGNHVAVGEHEAIRREDEPRAAAPSGFDPEHRGAHGVDRVDDRPRILIEQRIVVESLSGIHDPVYDRRPERTSPVWVDQLAGWRRKTRPTEAVM